VIPAFAEALLVGGTEDEVETPLDTPEASLPVVDPCQVCPLEDPCGSCAGYGNHVCRDTVAGVLSRCESTVPPKTRR
jgi:hypothetical protein